MSHSLSFLFLCFDGKTCKLKGEDMILTYWAKKFRCLECLDKMDKNMEPRVFISLEFEIWEAIVGGLKLVQCSLCCAYLGMKTWVVS
ncbi:hypothetical protein P8452_66814 [Trifolium repens]|nr:hypothetical protein P8452_66814 [Trifolium repens]